ncbi:MAG: helix-turn-helix domain-containing protein, partial [Chitinophagaceae bacterium]
LGRNTQRIREMIGMKQSVLASNTGFSQQYISKLEQSETFADDILEKVAEGLGVKPEVVKNFDEEAAVNIISNSFDNGAFLSQSHI